MSNPTRYFPGEKYIGSGDYIGCMEPAEDGDYVEWTEYVALRTDNERQRALLREAHDRLVIFSDATSHSLCARIAVALTKEG